jgi:hypothetical protein
MCTLLEYSSVPFIFCGYEGKMTYYPHTHTHTYLEHFFFIRFVRLLALRPLLAYCASLGG